MSEIKVNQISKKNGNNISFSDPLRLKSYTTTQRDALSGVSDGDIIFNSTDSKAQIYISSAWSNLGGLEVVPLDILVIGGGGGMRNDAQNGGGAGAGEFIEQSLFLSLSTNYNVTVGAGGSSGGANGSPSNVDEIASAGGGYGGRGVNFVSSAHRRTMQGGSGASGGGGGGTTNNTGNIEIAYGSAKNGNNGGAGKGSTDANQRTGGGGGGAGASGANNSGSSAGNGGVGLTTTIISTAQATTHSVGEVDGSDLYFSGGGGGGGKVSNGSGGLGGGGNEGQNGTANTGGGAGGSFSDTATPPNYAGGSGVVIIKYSSDYSITVGAGLTSATVADPPTGYKIEIFTAGTDNISFS